MANFDARSARHIIPEASSGLLPPEIATWLFENFSLLRTSVFADSIPTETVEANNTGAEIEIASYVFPANSLAQGVVIESRCFGNFIAAASSDAFTVRFKVDGIVLRTLIATVPASVTNGAWEALVRLTVREDGVAGKFVDYMRLHAASGVWGQAEGTEHSLDTTVAHTLSLTVQWNNAKAGNIVRREQGFIQLMNNLIRW